MKNYETKTSTFGMGWDIKRDARRLEWLISNKTVLEKANHVVDEYVKKYTPTNNGN